MGTLDSLQIVSKVSEISHGQGSGSHSLLVEAPRRAPLQARPGGTWPQQFMKVQISGPSGLRVHGLLKSVSRGGAQVVTRAAVPIRCPLEIAIAGCRPSGGEVFYCLRRSGVFQLGIVFPFRQKPNIALGAVATLRGLESPYEQGRGNVLDVGGSSVTVLCKTWVAAGARIRLESGRWILFGVVKNVIPTSMVGRCVDIHLEAAFPAQLDQPPDDEPVTFSSSIRPRAFAGLHDETSNEGVNQ
jgi:hypothetical protein